MATNRLLQDTVTVYVPKGENSSHVMQYDVYQFCNVYCSVSGGTAMSEGSLTPDDTLTLYIFDKSSRVYKSGEPMSISDTCEDVFYVVRNNTPKANVGDKYYIVPYATAAQKPPTASRRITQIYRRKAGSSRMWHWEVHAK